MTNKTVLHAKHLEAGAKMVDFYGWEMPINYGSQIEEHHAVRTDAGMFDVSHMTIVDVQGTRAIAIECCSVGEKVPDVISPSPNAVTTF